MGSKLRERIINPLCNSIKENKGTYIFYAITSALFLFTRLFRLTSLPEGMHIDEVSIGYNAWALSQYGVDRYNVSFPIYFNNAGSGQSGLFIYIAAIISKIFGYSLVTLRLTAVLFGMLLLIFGTLLAFEMFGKKASYITNALIVIMPVFIMGERWAFDCNAFLPMYALMLWGIVKLFNTEKVRYAILVGISAGLCLYSYILATIIVPITLVLVFIYAMIYKKVSFKLTSISALSSLIVAIPIILYIEVVLGLVKPFSILGISFTDASNRRTIELGLQNRSLKNILSCINQITTNDNYEFIATEKYGTVYSNRLIGFTFTQILLMVGIVFLIYKLVRAIIKKEFSYSTVLLISVISCLSPLMFTDGFAVYRYTVIFVPLMVMLAYMFSEAWESDVRIPSLLTAFVFLLNFVSYSWYIFGGSFSSELGSLSYFDTDLISLCASFDFGEYKDVDIYFDDTTSYNTGLLVLYGLRVPPADVIENSENLEVGGMTYKNIHIGIPESIDTMKKGVYVFRDLSNGASLYTDVERPMWLLETLVSNHNVEKVLQSENAEVSSINGYTVYVLK